MERFIPLLTSVSAAICLVGSVFLFLRSPGNRSRRILGAIMFVWALGFLGQLMSMLADNRVFIERDKFSPFTLIFGNCSILIVMYYLIELLRPGWINFRRGILMALPFAAVVGIYYGVLSLLDEPVIRLTSISELPAVAGKFNIWFRFVIFFFVLAYLALMIGISFHFMGKYKRWTDSNFASTARMDVTWLYYLAAGQIITTISFVVGILILARPVNFVIHQLVFEIFFSFLLYKALFHENPYPEGFFRHTLDDGVAEAEVEPSYPQAFIQQSEDTFEKKLPEYVASLREWLDEEKPYLDKDFKLTDVARRIPLNRTYLSRIFNEGYKQSFYLAVQQFRIEEAKRIIEQNPRLVSKELYPLCGFASEAMFHRTFTRLTGMTPKQYRAIVNH